ncbi:PQQ-dependent sugar dehydrogenase [Mycobacterium sp. AMU20-3851]|uniref:PQQ-dependent sugar dehydrogenase n=1 Tax=Mycobacterium sp. AMU20-3851 TaxID=3122055 RepID=UPI0037541516
MTSHNFSGSYTLSSNFSTARPAAGTGGRHRQQNTPYSRHIGRVGALALALGVFGAAATNTGVAYADTSESSTSTSSPGEESSGGTQTGTTSNTDPGASTAEAPGGAGPSVADGADVDNGPDLDDEGEDTQLAGRNDDLADEAEDEELQAELPDEPLPDTAPVEELPLEGPTEELPPTGGETGAPPAEPGPAPEPTDSTPTGGNTAPTDTDNAPQIPDAVIPVGNEVEDAPEAAALTEELADPGIGSARTASDAGGEAAALLAAATAPVGAATSNPIAGLIAQIPTPGEVVAGIKRFVTQCACALVKGAIDLLSNFAPSSSPAPGGPASPLDQIAGLAVFGWIRRQINYVAAAFNRTPIGQFVNQIGANVREWMGNLNNSPFGRQLSAGVAAFLAECEGRVALPSEFDRTTVVSGLNEPTDFELIMHDGDSDHVHQILFTEKSGAIKLYDTHSKQLTTLTTLVVQTSGGERGLIGIEVDPNYWNSDQPGYQKIYVAYTNAENFDQLSSFTFDGSALSNEQKLVQSTLSANDFHHGGEIEFDVTGQYILWAVGNNTRPTENSQDLTNIHGKILRLNRDGTGAVDNPFYVEGGDENTNRIYAYGMRNPFRFAVDPDNGAILSGDVGEYTWEELNLVRPGANYGWPVTEGPQPGSGFADPLYAYRHTLATNTGSITAVMVYDDGNPVAGQKKVLIADYSLGWIKELTFDDQYTSLIGERTIDSGAGAVVKMSQGPNGEIYQLNIYPGTLSMITPSDGNRTPVAVIKASSTSGPGNSLEVDFDGTFSTDPDNDTLTYAWTFGNGQTSTAAKPATVTFTNTGNFTTYTVSLTVTDELGKQSTATQQIVVGSTPPAADFDVPAGQDWKYNAGDTVSFHATGTDLEDGPGGSELPAGAFSWTVEFRHADHKHPFINEITGPDLSFTVPVDYDQLANTWYRVILTVTDSSGLKTVVTKDINPNLVTLTFGSNVPGAKYTLDGIPHTGTHTEQVVVGVERTLGAMSPQTINGQQYVFGSWSNGEGSTHVITTPDTDGTYTVNYLPAPAPAVLV